MCATSSLSLARTFLRDDLTLQYSSNTVGRENDFLSPLLGILLLVPLGR